MIDSTTSLHIHKGLCNVLNRETTRKRTKDAWNFFESTADISHAIFAAVPGAGEPGGAAEAILVIGWRAKGLQCGDRQVYISC